MTLLDIIIIGIVEGLTEYMPISSTAHIIFTLNLLGVPEDSFIKILIVSIQLGAILAVVVLYRNKFFDFSRITFYSKLIVAVIPALILGSLFHPTIEAVINKPVYIAIVLIIGGVVLLFVDRYFNHPTTFKEEDISYRQAFFIGFWQCVAMMPGVSRSAASIIGGMQQKLSRTLAAEFSFFLAVPTMCAATGFSLFIKNWDNGGSTQKGYEIIMSTPDNIKIFLVGSLVSFIVAILAIKLFIGLI
ncbi:MAG: undecaprenyl-diphosphate phosphatase, partial [Neisseriaceae bacterium]|nr:undecaprenyl-diphosphate phosphatase [Neisseriaceae bacterium]